jgi:hypothetical protein
MTAPADLTPAELEALTDDARSIAPFRITERRLCGCEIGSDACDDEDHDLRVNDRVVTDGPIGAMVVMEDLHGFDELAERTVRVVNAAPRLLAMAERLARLEPLLAEWEQARQATIDASDFSVVCAAQDRYNTAVKALLAALRGAR